jgi:hypothetical protein
MIHMRSGVTLISNFFSSFHVPWVKETPSMGFFGDHLLLSTVFLNFPLFSAVKMNLYLTVDFIWRMCDEKPNDLR